MENICTVAQNEQLKKHNIIIINYNEIIMLIARVYVYVCGHKEVTRILLACKILIKYHWKKKSKVITLLTLSHSRGHHGH